MPRPVPFDSICALLDDLEKLATRGPRLNSGERRKLTRTIVDAWFKKHRTDIDAPSANVVALLSTLFPERRTDRVYGIQHRRLSTILGKCLLLSKGRQKQLDYYLLPGHGDLADCAERALRDYDGDKSPRNCVTVDEIDAMLLKLASLCRFSSPAVRSSSNPTLPQDPDAVLRPVLDRMRSYEIKWIVRLMLKDFSPVVLDFGYVTASCHFLLPGLLKLQESFEAAVALLKGPLKNFHANPDRESQILLKHQAAQLVQPQVGIKLGRPHFHTARSISHCLKLVDKKKWAVERKYDGEFCEVHVDLQNERDRIKIFSKSGKDSTEDRKSLHPAITGCLKLDSPDCPLKRHCVLVGELVVFSDLENDILPFHKIRQHVSRSGSFLGVDKDSQPKDHEHLMIIFFDVLIIDDDVTLMKPYEERRRLMNKVLTKIPGRAVTSEWKTIDFSKDRACRALVHEFAASVGLRYEGLVLKPANAAYFSLLDDMPGQWHSGFIKIKKDHMQELGGERDVADLVVIGASYSAQQARRLNNPGIQWTIFHLGCLANSEEVRFGSKPLFRVVGMIEQDHCIPLSELTALNNVAKFNSKPFLRASNRLRDADGFDLLLDSSPDSSMDVVLTKPAVVEVLGSGFDKPANKDFFMLRHPRILKIHLDRDWNDAVSVDQLAKQAKDSLDAPQESQPLEMDRLVEAMCKKAQRKSNHGELRSSLTPRTDTTKRSTSSRSPLSAHSGNVLNEQELAKSPSARVSATARRSRTKEDAISPPKTRIRTARASQAKENYPTNKDCSRGEGKPDKHSLSTSPTSACDLPGKKMKGKCAPVVETEQSSSSKRKAQQTNDQQHASSGKRLRSSRANISGFSLCGHTPIPQVVDGASLCAVQPLKTLPAMSQTSGFQGCTPLSISKQSSSQSAASISVSERPLTSGSSPGLRTSQPLAGSPLATRMLMFNDAGPSDRLLPPHAPRAQLCRTLSPLTECEICDQLGLELLYTASVFYVRPQLRHSNPNDIIGHLHKHGLELSSDIREWVRADSPAEQDELVPESPAHPGKSYVVLADSEFMLDFFEVANEVQKLKIRKNIDFYDYRVLTPLPNAELPTTNATAQQRRPEDFLLGRSWYNTDERAVALSTNKADWAWDSGKGCMKRTRGQ